MRAMQGLSVILVTFQQLLFQGFTCSGKRFDLSAGIGQLLLANRQGTFQSGNLRTGLIQLATFVVGFAFGDLV
jgi:hypothetical protein